jgi:anti-sigma28 factor (negative regulator of flagellin synthesis)
MRIQGSGPRAVETKQEAPRADKRDKASAAGEAVVVKTDAGGHARAVEREAAAHEARVAEIALQLRDGTYQVDKDRLAARMFEDESTRSGARAS